jgi:hypothetical protein
MTKMSTLLTSTGLLLTLLSLAQAADGPAKKDKPKNPTLQVISVTIHPAALPKPALKYHFLPTFLERTPGSAIPCYVKAFIFNKQSRNYIMRHHPKNDSDLNNVIEWGAMPLDAMPRDRVRELVASFRRTLEQVELAVRREHCDWDVPLRQGNTFEIELPEVQDARDIARVLALRARLYIAEKKYAEAIASIGTGYGLARQIAEQPFLVGGLLGTTIVQIMNDQLLTLCQQPGAPNLYWSIAELPSPIIDRLKCLDGEYDALYLQYPELQTVRHAQYTPEQWDGFLRKFVSQAVHYENKYASDKLSDKDEAAKVAKIITSALEAIPRAKNDLIVAGHDQKELDAMPPAHIVVLHTLVTYDRVRDEQYKWWHLPYWQAREGLEEYERQYSSASKQELNPIFSLILPGASTEVVETFARKDRQLAALRCIEALRLYAAGHKGKLPAMLDQIKEVPIPLNPITGKAFSYRLDGNIAILDADGGTATEGCCPIAEQYRVTVAK